MCIIGKPLVLHYLLIRYYTLEAQIQSSHTMYFDF